jgi:serine phosphatase RsbU (regulator of sigma subunit)/CHASE1-domain containing sensor protein
VVERSTAPRLERRRRWRWLLLALLLLAILVLGFGSASIAWSKEDQRVAARKVQLVDMAGQSIAEKVNSSMAALRGADGIAADGVVTHAEFAAYASDVVKGSSFKMVAHEVVVTGAQRAAFERVTGLQIMDGSNGKLVPAPRKPSYVPVVDVAPVVSSLPSVLGFDITSDPVRAAATQQAAKLHEPVLSAPVHLAGTSRNGVFVVVPLITGEAAASGRVIGFVSSGIAASDLVTGAVSALPHGSHLTLSDGGTVLYGPRPSDGAATTRLPVAGRTWTVSVMGGVTPNRVWPFVIVAAALALAACVLVWARRDLRYQRRRDRDVVRDSRLADVARRLSFAMEHDEVIDVIDHEVAGVLDADAAHVGWLVDPHHLTMTDRAPDLDRPVLEALLTTPIDAPLPTAEAVREDRTVVVPDLARYLGDDEPLRHVAVARGVQATAACPLYDSSGSTMGVLAFVWSAAFDGDGDMARTLETLARLCGQTLRRTRLTSDANELADLASSLAATASRLDVARELEWHVRERVGARRVVLRLSDPALERLVPVDDGGAPEAFEARWEDLSSQARTPSSSAFALNRPVWLGSSDELAHAFTEVGELARASGICATAAVPLRAPNGSPLGVLATSWDHELRIDEETKSFLLTVGNQAAQTLERIRLDEREGAAARSGQAIAELGEQLASAASHDEAIEVLAAGAHLAIGADLSYVATRLDDHVLVTAGRLGREGTASPDPRPLDVDDPCGAAVLRDELVLVPNLGAHGGRFTDSFERFPELADTRATVWVPLRDGDLQVFGAIGLVWHEPQHFDAVDRSRFATLGAVAERTLERARLRQALYDAQQGVVLSLQRQLLRPLEEVPGLELAAHYEPASSEVGMGGDWYDTVPLDDGSLVVIMGDVVGHGVEAIAAMAQLQHLVTGLVRTGTSLEQVLPQVNAIVDDDTFATAQLLHIDPARHRVGYVNAGHPWALVRQPGGRVTVLSGSVLPLIGVASRPVPLSYVDLGPGSMVLAYTDGLIERRHEPLTDGIDRLGDALARADRRRPTTAILGDLVREVRGGPGMVDGVNDDVAVVLARIDPS